MVCAADSRASGRQEVLTGHNRQQGKGLRCAMAERFAGEGLASSVNGRNRLDCRKNEGEGTDNI